MSYVVCRVLLHHPYRLYFGGVYAMLSGKFVHEWRPNRDHAVRFEHWRAAAFVAAMAEGTIQEV